MVGDYQFKQVAVTIEKAIDLAGGWGAAYRDASPQVRRQINQAFFKAFLIDFGGVAGAVVTDDFGRLLNDGLIQRFERRSEAIAGHEPKALTTAPFLALPAGQRPLVPPASELVLSGVGSSKASLVEVRGLFLNPEFRRLVLRLHAHLQPHEA